MLLFVIDRLIVDEKLLNVNILEKYRQEIAKNKSLFNLINQLLKMEAEKTKGMTNDELDNFILKTADKHLKRLYEGICLVGDSECTVFSDVGLNGYQISLTVYQRNLDNTFDLLVAYAIQTKEFRSTKLMGYGLSAICVGAAAGILTLNPMVGFAAGAAVATATGAKATQEHAEEMPAFAGGFLIDELLKWRFLKINADGELEF